MGSGPTEAGDESVDASAASATGPDWGQVALVLVAAAILALAAVTIPPLGGVGFQEQGPAQPAGEEGSDGFLQLGSGGSGDQQVGSGGSGSEAGTGDSEGTESADGEGSDSLEDGAGSVADGDQPGEAGDGASESGAGSDSNSDSEFDGGERQQDGTAGDQSGDGSEVGSADGDGAEDPSQGEFGTGSGDGTAGEPGDGTAEDPGSQSDGQGTAGDGTTSEDGTSDSSGDPTDGADSETGDGSGESTDEGGTNGDESTTGDGDSSQDGTGDGDTGSGDGSSERDTQDSSGDGETEDGEDADDTSEDGTDEDGTSYEISFDDQPTPGSTIEVTVTGDGDPVEGATVYFNDEQIGTTDADGTVTGEVPYTETLEVRADVSPTETETTTARGSIAGPTPGLDSSRQFHGAVAMPLSMAQVQDSQAEGENGTRTTVEMNPETNLTIDGDPIAGTNITVVATVDGNPIPQGTVSVDGVEYGATGDDGAAVVPVPETPGNATIAVERGEIRAERTITVETLSLTVDDRFPLPGRSVDARLEYGNGSVANATILVDGTAAATTGADGTATVGLPLADEATIAAEYEGARATTTVDGLYRNAALLLLAVVVGVVLLWRLAVRYGVGDRVRSLPSPASLLQRIGDALRMLGRRTVDAIVRLARTLESFGYWIAGRARAVARALERAGRWIVALPGELATKGLAALAALHPIRLYRFLRDVIRSLMRSSREQVDDVTEAVTGTDSAAAGGDEGTDEDVRTVRELWAEFVRLVRPPRLRTKTPGEIGRYAVEKGFPEPPVRTVVDAFRDSEYGKTAPSGDRLERVRSAVRSVTDDADDDGRDRESIDKDGDKTGTESERR